MIDAFKTGGTSPWPPERLEFDPASSVPREFPRQGYSFKNSCEERLRELQSEFSADLAVDRHKHGLASPRYPNGA